MGIPSQRNQDDRPYDQASIYMWLRNRVFLKRPDSLFIPVIGAIGCLSYFINLTSMVNTCIETAEATPDFCLIPG
jgi:hypothetical protein